MNTKINIELTIDRLPKGYVFTYSDLNTEVMSKEAIIKALNRMVASGRLAKLSKGRFYKPEGTTFGNLQPNQFQIVKDLLEENGKTIGYLTGYSIYNKLGLTTQVSNTIEVGKNEIRPKFKRGRYTISFIKQKNTITKKNVPLLQILDSIRYINKIPDATIATLLERFLDLLGNLSDDEISSLIRLGLKYPPATRALVGAICEQTKHYSLVAPLLKSLNPITKYKLVNADKVLTNAKKWNII